MLDRRDLLRALVLGGGMLAAQPVLAACGSAPSGRSGGKPMTDADLAMSSVARAAGAADAIPDSAGSIRAFTTDLYRAVAKVETGNLIASPYSVATALAMARNGARGQTAAEMDAVLHARGLTPLNGGLNALGQVVESRAGSVKRADGSEASLQLDLANSLWGQRGIEWGQPFLDALARDYGAGMRMADYVRDAAAAQVAINAWTADATHDRITDIIPDGVLDAMTRLVLVNAIYLRAPWEEPFKKSQTRTKPFMCADGSTVSASTMSGGLSSARYGRASGYQAARLSYAGSQVAMTVILPDSPDLGAFEQSLDADRLTQVLADVEPVSLLEVQLPKFDFRSQVSLGPVLADLGMPTALDPTRADFGAMTAQESLFISAVLHQGFIAVDEEGTEAAAATAAVMTATGMPMPTPFVVDRPFLFVIHDVETATPLFIGRVTDPTA